MAQAVPDSVVQGWQRIEPGLTGLPDADDRHVLAAAICGHADAIVTFNLADFPAAALAPIGVEAQHPDDFLINRVDLNPIAALKAISDEDTVERWSKNPYWQHFSCERSFQHELPCDPSSLVHWCQRIGEAGCEWLLAQNIQAARRGRVITRASLATVVQDTTAQPKAIAHPTDSRLLNRAREQLEDAAQEAGIAHRQSYARVGKAAKHQAGRYAHARQYQRMRREIRMLRTWLGRVIRDVQRKGGGITGTLNAKIDIAQHLVEQRRNSKNKLYALHAQEVECIAYRLAPTRRTSLA